MLPLLGVLNGGTFFFSSSSASCNNTTKEEKEKTKEENKINKQEVLTDNNNKNLKKNDKCANNNNNNHLNNIFSSDFSFISSSAFLSRMFSSKMFFEEVEAKDSTTEIEKSEECIKNVAIYNKKTLKCVLKKRNLVKKKTLKRILKRKRLVEQQKIFLKKQNDILRNQILHIQEDYLACQSIFDTLKTFFKNRIKKLVKEFLKEKEEKEAAQSQVIFLEDKCFFIEEQTQAILSKISNELETKNELIKLYETKLESQLLKNNSCQSVDHAFTVGSADFEFLQKVLKTRESQLEIITSELDATNTLYLKSLDESKHNLDKIEKLSKEVFNLQIDLNNEINKGEELLLQNKQNENAHMYSAVRYSNSAPFTISLEDNKFFSTSIITSNNNNINKNNRKKNNSNKSHSNKNNSVKASNNLNSNNTISNSSNNNSNNALDNKSYDTSCLFFYSPYTNASMYRSPTNELFLTTLKLELEEIILYLNRYEKKKNMRKKTKKK